MPRVIIIGGGIIGLTSAYYLSKSGWQVTVIDKGDLCDSCSYGNAGMIVPSHFVPLAAPGMVEQGILWMLNSKSPFFVRPALNLQLINWGLKFLKSATLQNVERAAIPLRDLSLLSKELYTELQEDLGSFDLQQKGILMMFKTEKVAEEEAHMAERAKKLGLHVSLLSAAECHKLQSGLSLDILGAVHYKCDAHLYPLKLMKLLIEAIEKQGATIVRNQAVDRIKTAGVKVEAVCAGNEEFSAEEYVIAGGSWSPQIGKLAGLNIPLMPGKGYSFMIEEKEKRMSIPAILCEARVAITPMNGHVRIGGTMEIDKINSRINMSRVLGIVESTRRYFPELNPEMPLQKNVWYGFRPCSPDGLPYIGKTDGLKNLTVATGHGMMGLSLGPATGKLVSEIVAETRTSIEITPFSMQRFN